MNGTIYNRQRDLHLHQIRSMYIIGVGGIGSWVALFAALTGKVKTLYLYDDDILEESNLNRTPFRLCDIGVPKVDAITALINERRLTERYPVICPMKERFTEDTIVADSVDNILIDCRDGLYGDCAKIENAKVYKVSYDGLSVTLDGDYKNRVVWGQREGGYEVVPSFICPAVFIANLVITDIFLNSQEDRFNEVATFDISDVANHMIR